MREPALLIESGQVVDAASHQKSDWLNSAATVPGDAEGAGRRGRRERGRRRQRSGEERAEAGARAAGEAGQEAAQGQQGLDTGTTAAAS